MNFNTMDTYLVALDEEKSLGSAPENWSMVQAHSSLYQNHWYCVSVGRSSRDGVPPERLQGEVVASELDGERLVHSP
jgi:hypothetical protein